MNEQVSGLPLSKNGGEDVTSVLKRVSNETAYWQDFNQQLTNQGKY